MDQYVARLAVKGEGSVALAVAVVSAFFDLPAFITDPGDPRDAGDTPFLDPFFFFSFFLFLSSSVSFCSK